MKRFDLEKARTFGTAIQRAQLGRDDAALAIKMLREHVRGDE
jgi:hypothetical protein